MAVSIIEGQEPGSYRTRAVFYDTVTDWAFGPVFKDADEANAFLDYLVENNLGSPRSMEDADLKNHYHEFLKIKNVQEVMSE